MLPFDLLQNASPIRVDLVQFVQDGYVVGLSVHQIVCDCWSAALFFDELSETYNEMLTGAPRTGSARELSYLAYSHWMNEAEQLAMIEESNTI